MEPCDQVQHRSQKVTLKKYARIDSGRIFICTIFRKEIILGI